MCNSVVFNVSIEPEAWFEDIEQVLGSEFVLILFNEIASLLGKQQLSSIVESQLHSLIPDP